MAWPFSRAIETPSPMTLAFDGTRYLELAHGSCSCRIRIFASPDRPTVVVATELPDESGRSVFDAGEVLAWDVCELFGIDPARLRWVEERPDGFGGGFAWADFGQPVDGRFVEYWCQWTTREAVEAVIGRRLDERPIRGSYDSRNRVQKRARR